VGAAAQQVELNGVNYSFKKVFKLAEGSFSSENV